MGTLLGQPATATTLGQRLEAEGIAADIKRQCTVLDQYLRERGEGWKKIKERKDAGYRADPAFTHNLLRRRLGRLEPGASVVLEGFPESIGEFGRTDRILPGRHVDCAILLECRTTVCAARIARRLVCGGCGTIVA